MTLPSDPFFLGIAGLLGLHLGVTLLNTAYLRWGRSNMPPPDALPRLSVLIPARNEAHNLRRLLPELSAQRYTDVQFIVYNDGSEDGTQAVMEEHRGDPRFTLLQGDGPPPGWIGKVHALYQATRHADGQLYLFLDADAGLPDPRALERLVGRFLQHPEDSVLTGLTQLTGGGMTLVSMVPHAILSLLPWPLVRPIRHQALGALNGQCWMIRAEHYRQHEPHDHLRNAVLEDVEIGRYLKGQGLTPVLVDVQREVEIHMYRNLPEAWIGFQKNAYLILGGRPLSFLALWLFYGLTFVVGPLVYPILLGPAWLLKLFTDRLCHLPWHVSLLGPVSYALAWLVQADSARVHWTNKVTWKGRRV